MSPMPDGSMGIIAGLPPVIHAWLFVGFVWLLALALGRRASNWLRLPKHRFSPQEAGLVALTLGTGTLTLVPYVLGVLHALTPETIRVTLLVLALVLLPDAIGSREYLKPNPSPSGLKRARAWWALMLAMFAILMIHSLAFGNFGDDDGYHLSAPARWMRDRTLSYLPTYTNTNASMGFEMLYLVALAFGEAIGCKLLHFSAGLWALLAVYSCARRFGDWLSGITAVSFLLIATPLVNLPFIFPLAYTDFAACLAALVSVLVWLTWRDERATPLLLCLGLCAGIAASFKFTAITLVMAWGIVIVVDLRLHNQTWRTISSCALQFTSVALLPILPWLARNWQLTGNALYPMLASVVPTRDWTPEHGLVFSRYVRYYTWGIASGARLSEGTRKVLLVAAVLVVSLGAAVLWARSKGVAQRLLLVFASLHTILCIALTGLIFRYWLPSIACFVVIGALLLQERLPGTRARYAVAVGLLGLALATQLVREVRQPKLATEARLALGLSTPQQVQASDPIWQMWSSIEAATARDAHILVGSFYSTFGASSFGCFLIDRICFTTDSHLQHYVRLESWQDFLASVEAAHIQYLLLADQPPEVPGRHGFSFLAGKNEYPFCHRLALERGELIAHVGNLVFYRIRLNHPAATDRANAGVSASSAN